MYNLIPVRSSRMNAAGWNEGTMYIQFKNGALYAYYNVSESEYKAFISSPSLGQALNTFQHRHPYRRV